jgi:hyperosmotically inducible protein
LNCTFVSSTTLIRHAACLTGSFGPHHADIQENPTMVRRGWKAAVLVAAVTVLAAAGWEARVRAQDQEPPKTTSEKIKSKLGGAVDSIKKGAASAGEAVKERFAAAKKSVARMGIEARVYARIHWDRDLNAAKIDLSAPTTGTIELNGTVADAKLKAKAVELTRETLGVVEVVDHLTVEAAPAAATTDAPKKP